MLLLHDKQKEVARSTTRFKIIRAGRRSGKTSLEIELMLACAVFRANRNVFFIAPTQKQARSIVWEALKSRVGNVGEPNESRLEMRVKTQDNGYSTIYVAGWENRENFRGMKAHHVTFDEVDTCKDFFVGWQEIFRPALIDTSGTADFIGTPKKENPNLRRLEKENEDDPEWRSFHFGTADNPHIPPLEIDKARQELDATTYKQEILAEYVEDAGALFKYSALVDVFSNSIVKSGQKYLVVDIADDGSDKTVFNFWEDLESVRIVQFEHTNTEGIIAQIREYAAEAKIPYSNIAVDAIGVGAGVASSSQLSGIIGFKSTYQAMKTDRDAVRLPNIHYTSRASLISEYRNLRSQCVFTLAGLVNDHKVACTVSDVRIREKIIEELSFYQDASVGDGKRMATPKEDVKEVIGRSPDLSDTFIMRMYFVLRESLLPETGVAEENLTRAIKSSMDANRARQNMNETR